MPDFSLSNTKTILSPRIYKDRYKCNFCKNPYHHN